MLWAELHRPLAESFDRRTERETTEVPINRSHNKPPAEAKQVTNMLNVLWSAKLGSGEGYYNITLVSQDPACKFGTSVMNICQWLPVTSPDGLHGDGDEHAGRKLGCENVPNVHGPRESRPTPRAMQCDGEQGGVIFFQNCLNPIARIDMAAGKLRVVERRPTPQTASQMLT